VRWSERRASMSLPKQASSGFTGDDARELERSQTRTHCPRCSGTYVSAARDARSNSRRWDGNRTRTSN
jgi:hypothetical protein